MSPLVAALLHRVRRALPSRPPVRGRHSVPGLRGDVRITWTDGGIPHLGATSAADLFFAQGYVTASDRLFQMDLFRRTARGELAEIFGGREAPAHDLTVLFQGWTMVDVDHFMRQLSFVPTAQAAVNLLSPERRALVNAYAAGINAFLSEGPRPLECKLLGYRPRAWTAVDSELVWKAMAFQLSYGWRAGLAGEALRARFPRDPRKVRALLPDQRDVTDVMLPVWPGAAELLARTEAAAGSENPGGNGLGGSNGWAIAPSRTTEGRAILCGDPHLPFRAPAAGYLVHLGGDGYDVAGWSIPGVPGVLIGHNARIAWTITTGCAVDAQWAMEQLSTDGEQTRTATGFAPIELGTTDIVVRGEKAANRRILKHTANGPLFDAFAGVLPAGHAPALRWTGHLPSPDLEAVFDLDLVRDFASFRRVGERLGAPQLNVVYADVDGHIGWQFVGATPRFRSPPPLRAVPGWSAEHEWDGIEPPESLPWLHDPPDGLIVSANQRLLSTDTHPHLGEVFEPPYRARRIRQRLEADRSITLESAAAIQLDRLSGFGVDLRDRVLKRIAPRLRGGYPPLSKGAGEMLAAAIDWNGFATPESAGAAAAWAFTMAIVGEIFARPLGEPLLHAVFEQHSLPLLPLLRILAADGAPFLEPSAFDDACRRALSTAAARLNDRGWRLDATRTVSMRHPMSDVPGLGAVVTVGPIAWGGDGSTVSCAAFKLSGDGQVDIGPVLRHAVECGKWDGYRVIMAAGQSGNPASSRYDDLFARWRSGMFVTLPFSPDAVRAAAQHSGVLAAGAKPTEAK